MFGESGIGSQGVGQAAENLGQLRVLASDLEELLGIEGTAARLYFGAFAGMLKFEGDGGGREFSFDFVNRNRRPPKDPVNALMSFSYSLLTKDLTIICHSIGFDPFVGFFFISCTLDARR